MRIAVEVQRQPQFKLQQYNGYLDLSTATAHSQSIRQVSTPIQPPLTMYNQWQSTFTIDSISLQSEASSIHYVQPLAKEFHNLFGQSQLQNNVDELPTSTGTARLQSCRSLSTPLQPQFTMCKQWHNTFTIDSSSLKCEASSIDYVQAVVKQFHNQSD